MVHGWQQKIKPIICKKDIKKMWGEKMKKMDEKFKIWSNAPENPQDN